MSSESRDSGLTSILRCNSIASSFEILLRLGQKQSGLTIQDKTIAEDNTYKAKDNLVLFTPHNCTSWTFQNSACEAFLSW